MVGTIGSGAGGTYSTALPTITVYIQVLIKG
jgi:hypothetical protein